MTSQFCFFLALSLAVHLKWQHSTGQIQPKKSDVIVIEAEHFSRQEKSDIRRWHIITQSLPEEREDILNTASGKSYVQILPDTRLTHGDSLQIGVNFTEEPGTLAVITFAVKFPKAGRYYVWVSAYSTNTEDNGLHVGLEGTWPDSGRRIQLCDGKNSWYWTNNQRTDTNHCGEPHSIFLDIKKPGIHQVQFSMREDGFRFDRFGLTTDVNYNPNQ